MTRTDGLSDFIASAIPPSQPPPPMEATSTSTSGTCSRISSAHVPWPAMIASSSKAWMKT